MEILAYSYRGGLKDLSYTGNIAVVDSRGELKYYYGDPQKVAFARSSAKPMQAMCVLKSGAADAFGLTQEEIALLCASHGGESFHVNAVLSVLGKAGLDESYLQCGVHEPLYPPAAQALKESGQQPRQVHCNCSGKHSGMLITAKHLGESLDDYYTEEHGVQRRITHMIGDICGYEPQKIILGCDGCGVPVHALPLYNFAWGIAKMTCPDTLGQELAPLAARVTDAMAAYPKMCSGTGRLDAAIMENLGGAAFAKSGAAGYYIVGLRDMGLGIAVKIDDGDTDVRNMVVTEILRQLGYINDKNQAAFAPFGRKEIYNHKDEVVGFTAPEFLLHRA